MLSKLIKGPLLFISIITIYVTYKIIPYVLFLSKGYRFHYCFCGAPSFFQEHWFLDHFMFWIKVIWLEISQSRLIYLLYISPKKSLLWNCWIEKEAVAADPPHNIVFGNLWRYKFMARTSSRTESDLMLSQSYTSSLSTGEDVVRSFSRGCEPRNNRVDGCTEDTHFITCQTYCESDICNVGSGDPPTQPPATKPPGDSAFRLGVEPLKIATVMLLSMAIVGMWHNKLLS